MKIQKAAPPSRNLIQEVSVGLRICLYISSQVGTPVGNHALRGAEPGLETCGWGWEGPGSEGLSLPWMGQRVIGPYEVPQPTPLAVLAEQEGPLTSLQVMSESPLLWYRVTVPTHCFTSWKRRPEVKLETPGHISQPHPTSSQGLQFCPQSPCSAP